MPLLWEEVRMSGSRDIKLYTLLKYAKTIERVSTYIHTINFDINHLNDDMNNTKFDEVCKYLSLYLQIITIATRVKSLYLYPYLFEVDDYSLQFRTRFRTINDLVYWILKHAETMKLDKLYWNPNPKIGRSHALKIIGPKIIDMRLDYLGYEDWVDHLPNHERLTSIEVYLSRREDSTEFDRKFWTVIV